MNEKLKDFVSMQDLAFYVKFHAEIEAQTIDINLIDSEMEGIILEMISLLENLMLK